MFGHYDLLARLTGSGVFLSNGISTWIGVKAAHTAGASGVQAGRIHRVSPAVMTILSAAKTRRRLIPMAMI